MINKAILVGNVGSDPDVRDLPNGGRVANFPLATSDSWKDKSGSRKEKTEWHKIVIYNNNLIQVVEKYIKKGAMLYIEGSIKSNKYIDKSGNERYTTEIVIQSYGDTLKILSKSDNINIDYNNNDNTNNSIKDDEVPF